MRLYVVNATWFIFSSNQKTKPPAKLQIKVVDVVSPNEFVVEVRVFCAFSA